MSLINKLLDKLTEYIRLKGEKLKLDIIAHVSRLLAHFVVFMLVGLLGLFMLIFLSLAGGAYVNQLLNSTYYGYLIVAGFYLLLLILLLIILKSGKVQHWLESLFIRFGEGLNDESDD